MMTASVDTETDPQGRHGTHQKEALEGGGRERDAACHCVLRLPADTCDPSVGRARHPRRLPPSTAQAVTYRLSRGAGSSSANETPSSSSSLKTSPVVEPAQMRVSWDLSKNRDCHRTPVLSACLTAYNVVLEASCPLPGLWAQDKPGHRGEREGPLRKTSGELLHCPGAAPAPRWLGRVRWPVPGAPAAVRHPSWARAHAWSPSSDSALQHLLFWVFFF